MAGDECRGAHFFASFSEIGKKIKNFAFHFVIQCICSNFARSKT